MIEFKNVSYTESKGNKKITKQVSTGSGVLTTQGLPSAFVPIAELVPRKIMTAYDTPWYSPPTEGSFTSDFFKEKDIFSPTEKDLIVKIGKAKYKTATDYTIDRITNADEMETTMRLVKEGVEEIFDNLNKVAQQDDITDVKLSVVGIASPEFRQFRDPESKRKANEALAKMRGAFAEQVLETLLDGGRVIIGNTEYRLDKEVLDKLKQKKIEVSVDSKIVAPEKANQLELARGFVIGVEGYGEKITEEEIPQEPEKKEVDKSGVYRFVAGLLPSRLKEEPVRPVMPENRFYPGPFGKEAYVVNGLHNYVSTLAHNIGEASKALDNQKKREVVEVLRELKQTADKISEDPQLVEFINNLFKPSPTEALKNMYMLAKIESERGKQEKMKADIELAKAKRQEIINDISLLEDKKDLLKLEKGKLGLQLQILKQKLQEANLESKEERHKAFKDMVKTFTDLVGKGKDVMIFQDDEVKQKYQDILRKSSDFIEILSREYLTQKEE
ncbi:MAG: hypothetical protein ABDH28_05580 [Brevinematia bacterium]